MAYSGRIGAVLVMVGVVDAACSGQASETQTRAPDCTDDGRELVVGSLEWDGGLVDGGIPRAPPCDLPDAGPFTPQDHAFCVEACRKFPDAEVISCGVSETCTTSLSLPVPVRMVECQFPPRTSCSSP